MLRRYSISWTYFAFVFCLVGFFTSQWTNFAFVLSIFLTVLCDLKYSNKVYIPWGNHKITSLDWLKIRSLFSVNHALATRLTLYLPVLSAHNLCKQIGPRSGPTKGRVWSGSNRFDTHWYNWNNFLKKLILKKISRRQKSMKNFPCGKELMLY